MKVGRPVRGPRSPSLEPGASPGFLLWRVTLPGIRWGVVYGVVLLLVLYAAPGGAAGLLRSLLTGRAAVADCDGDRDATRQQQQCQTDTQRHLPTVLFALSRSTLVASEVELKSLMPAQNRGRPREGNTRHAKLGNANLVPASTCRSYGKVRLAAA